MHAPFTNCHGLVMKPALEPFRSDMGDPIIRRGPLSPADNDSLIPVDAVLGGSLA